MSLPIFWYYRNTAGLHHKFNNHTWNIGNICTYNCPHSVVRFYQNDIYMWTKFCSLSLTYVVVWKKKKVKTLMYSLFCVLSIKFGPNKKKGALQCAKHKWIGTESAQCHDVSDLQLCSLKHAHCEFRKSPRLPARTLVADLHCLSPDGNTGCVLPVQLRVGVAMIPGTVCVLQGPKA